MLNFCYNGQIQHKRFKKGIAGGGGNNRKQLKIKIKAHDLMDAYRGVTKLWKYIQDGKLDIEEASQSIAELGRRLKHGNH